LITKLHDEIVAYRGEIDNFASFLRVCCLRYLSLMADGRIPSDKRVPIAGMHPSRQTPSLVEIDNRPPAMHTR
jgi:predicted DNA-binding ribbon-helix-helix protein